MKEYEVRIDYNIHASCNGLFHLLVNTIRHRDRWLTDKELSQIRDLNESFAEELIAYQSSLHTVIRGKLHYEGRLESLEVECMSDSLHSWSAYVEFRNRDEIIEWLKALRLIHGKHWSIDHVKVEGDFKTIFEMDERGRIKEHVGVVVIDEGLDE